MANDYYQLLKLSRNAADLEIKKAYRQQFKIWQNQLNAPNLKRRQEAERMLEELDAARRVLLNSKRYNGGCQERFEKKSARKKRIKRKKKRASRFTTPQVFKIISKGLSMAVKHILTLVWNFISKAFEFVLSSIWKTIRFIAIALVVFLLGCLFLTGLGGIVLFATSIYNNQFAEAAGGLLLCHVPMSIITYFKYWRDLQKAKRNLWRTSEAELHFFELMGGWLGGFFAMLFIKHKRTKETFQLVFWLIFLFHASLLLFFIPASFPYAIPQKFILIINAFFLIVSLDAIRKKGNIA